MGFLKITQDVLPLLPTILIHEDVCSPIQEKVPISSTFSRARLKGRCLILKVSITVVPRRLQIAEEGHGRISPLVCVLCFYACGEKERLWGKEESHRTKGAGCDTGSATEKSQDFIKPHNSEKMGTYKQPVKHNSRSHQLGTC